MTSRSAGSSLTSFRSNNSENEGRLRGKAENGRITKGRVAMKDIGNKASNLLPIAKNNSKITKKEVTKPARGLTKQKATSTLPQLSEVTTRVTRRSTEQKKAEIKEQEENKNEDVEMDNLVSAFSTKNIQTPTPAFSTKNLGPIENIDKDDVDNPQMVSEYVDDIYGYLRQMEKERPIQPDYLKGENAEGTNIQPKMRTLLVDWLVQVAQEFNLLQETLYLSVATLDRFLQKNANKYDKSKLQLIGVSSMFIACKYEEMYAPEIGDFTHISDNDCSESSIKKMEIKILESLGFDLSRPLALHFLRRNSKAGGVDVMIHTLAKYAMELTLVQYHTMHYTPSKLAAAALALSMKILGEEDKPFEELWTPTLEHYTSYSFEQIRQYVVDLAALMWDTTEAPRNAKFMTVRKKYEDKKFMKIAKLADLTGPRMKQMKTGTF